MGVALELTEQSVLLQQRQRAGEGLRDEAARLGAGAARDAHRSVVGDLIPTNNKGKYVQATLNC